MNIALIGSGGREHAICEKIALSNKTKNIFCIPGNAGTSKIAENIDLNINNFPELLKVLKFKKIDLVIVGPEEPLVKGLSDYLKKHKIKVFGPSRFAANLEGSKAFMKALCKRNNIPTADYKICKNKKDVTSFVKKNSLPIVVKADGLAAGKGVTICKSKDQIYKISKEIFNGKFQSSKKLVLEKFINGEEASYFIIVDKKNYKFFGTAQDHKKVGEKDTGPNTGGMGAYSPSNVINKRLEKKIIHKIIQPTLLALKRKKQPYTGFLYVGLMIKNDEPYLIEFNVRMGDPECQTILPTLNSDLLDILISCCDGTLNQTNINFSRSKSICVVLCSKGYPDKFKNNIEIKNLEQLKLLENQNIFHAGTLKTETNITVSNGGRVLNFVSTSDDFSKCREEAINLIKKLNWENGYFRRDIGHNVIKK